MDREVINRFQSLSWNLERRGGPNCFRSARTSFEIGVLAVAVIVAPALYLAVMRGWLWHPFVLFVLALCLGIIALIFRARNVARKLEEKYQDGCSGKNELRASFLHLVARTTSLLNASLSPLELFSAFTAPETRAVYFHLAWFIGSVAVMAGLYLMVCLPLPPNARRRRTKARTGLGKLLPAH